MKRISLVAFILVCVAELLAIAADIEYLHLASKPLIMITLACYYWFSTERSNPSTIVLLALAFSFLGDTILLFEQLDPLYFVMGLASFLLAHLFYIFAYRQHRNKEVTTALQGVQRTRFAFPIILAVSGLIVILYPRLGAFRIPVIVYSFVIVIMVLSALFRYGRTSSQSFRLVFGGALLFMISDALLAINKFLQPLPYAAFLIMITYVIAQLMIIKGLLEGTNYEVRGTSGSMSD